MSVFENNRLLFRENDSGHPAPMDAFLNSFGVEVTQQMPDKSREVLKQIIIVGLGISLMSLIGLKNELKDKELKIIPFKGLPIKTTWNLVWQRSKNLSPVANAYLEYVNSEKDKLIHDLFGWYENY